MAKKKPYRVYADAHGNRYEFSEDEMYDGMHFSRNWENIIDPSAISCFFLDKEWCIQFGNTVLTGVCREYMDEGVAWNEPVLTITIADATQPDANRIDIKSCLSSFFPAPTASFQGRALPATKGARS